MKYYVKKNKNFVCNKHTKDRKLVMISKAEQTQMLEGPQETEMD